MAQVIAKRALAHLKDHKHVGRSRLTPGAAAGLDLRRIRVNLGTRVDLNAAEPDIKLPLVHEGIELFEQPGLHVRVFMADGCHFKDEALDQFGPLVGINDTRFGHPIVIRDRKGANRFDYVAAHGCRKLALNDREWLAMLPRQNL